MSPRSHLMPYEEEQKVVRVHLLVLVVVDSPWLGDAGTMGNTHSTTTLCVLNLTHRLRIIKVTDDATLTPVHAMCMYKPKKS